MRKTVLISVAALLAATSAYSQVRTPPAIPTEKDSVSVKRERCAESISDLYGWQLGQAKRLREWCRVNGYITYKQQLEAEK